jgi:uncharacterized protein (DUF58 family)
MLAVGLYKGINLLVLLGYTVPVAQILNAAATRRLRALRSVRRLPGSIFAGGTFEMELRLHNSETTPLPAGRLEDGGAAHRRAWPLTSLGPGETRLEHGRIQLQRRGRYAWGPLTAISAEPLGLIERRVEVLPGREIIVFPALGTLDREGLERHLLGSRDADPERARSHPQRHPTARAEFHGLRPFRPGDSPRSVHWRTSARTGELMVREYEDFTGQNLVLIFDPSLPRGGWRERELAFEAALSFAATICWEWCGHRGDRLVVARGGAVPQLMDGVTGPEHARRVLECLALSEPSAPGGSGLELDWLTTASLPAGPVAVVTAAAGSMAERLRQALHRPVTVLDAALAERQGYYRPPQQAVMGRRVPIPDL